MSYSIWGGGLLPLALWTVSMGGDSATGPGWVLHTWGAGQVLQHRICILIYEVTSNVSLPFFCEEPLPPQPSIRGNIPNENKAFKQILLFRKMSTKLSVWRGQGRLFLYQVRQSISYTNKKLFWPII